MSDTRTEQRWTLRAYHETPEHCALRGQLTPPPDPIVVARTQLNLMIREAGYTLDLHSVREDARIAVIVNDLTGQYREVTEDDDEPPTGHIVDWSATGSQKISRDAADPIVRAHPTGEDEVVRAEVPEECGIPGGSMRVQHDLGGSVTVTAIGLDGSPIGYLFATPIDDNVVLVEMFGGTSALVVAKD